MSTDSLPEYTWQEIAEHNTKESAWVYYEDYVYDVTKFLDRHPGGRDMLLLMAGRDITNYLPTYHPFSEEPYKVLDKFKIGKLRGPSEFGSFKPDSGFYKTLRRRVGKYFKDNNIDYKDYRPGLIRYLFITFMIFFCWYFAWSCRIDNGNNTSYNYFVESCELAFRHRIYLMIIAGIFQGMLLIHTMHDCSHTSFTHSPIIWKFMGRICLDLTTGNSFDAWLHQHTVGHHEYTNILEVDPDVPMQAHGM